MHNKNHVSKKSQNDLQFRMEEVDSNSNCEHTLSKNLSSELPY